MSRSSSPNPLWFLAAAALGGLGLGAGVWALQRPEPAAPESPPQLAPETGPPAPAAPEGPGDLQKGQVTLHIPVTDLEGRPLPDCGASLMEVVPEGKNLYPGGNAGCVDGVLTWTTVAPGSYQLNVAATGTAILRTRVEITQESGELTLDPLALGPGGTVMGRVTFEGEPVGDAYVALAPAGEVQAVEADGQFVLQGVPPGLTELVVGSPQRLSGAARVVVEPGQVHVVDVALSALPTRGVLGLRFETLETGLLVVAVHPAGPAAGRLGVGDTILAVDGVETAGMDWDSAHQALGGDAGSQVVLTVRGEPDLKLTRAPIETLQ